MLSHRNLMAMAVAHLADVDAVDENTSLLACGADVARLRPLHPGLCRARRTAGDSGVIGIRATANSSVSAIGIRRAAALSRADDGAAATSRQPSARASGRRTCGRSSTAAGRCTSRN